jgi:hypothetical protein
VGETVNGINNSSDDDDYFRMRLEKGKKYTIGAGIDDYIDAEDLNLLIDSSGQVIARNFAGVPSGISVPATGTYYVAHSSFADSARGRYTLRLTTP